MWAGLCTLTAGDVGSVPGLGTKLPQAAPHKPMDLPLVLRRSIRKAITRKHKKNLGKSIELRDESVLTREEFGNWELDTVRGIKDKHDEVIISLLERKT